MSPSIAGKGLVYAEGIANGRFVTYEVSPEIQRAYRNIERDYPNLRCLWDNEYKEHLILEDCKDGQLRRVFARPGNLGFPEDLIRVKLERANSEKFDVFDELEEAEREAEREWDHRFSEIVSEAGEKLAKAFADDGLTVRTRMTPLSVPMKRQRRLRNFEAPARTIGNR